MGEPTLTNAADMQLAAFLDAEWAAELARSPELASYQGDRSGDDRWDDVGLDARSADLERARAAAIKLEQLDIAALTPESRLNADLYAARLRDKIAGFALGAQLFGIDPRHGVHTDATIVSILPFESRRDFEALIARINGWPRKVEQTIEVLREAIARGRIWPREVMIRVPEHLDRLDVAPDDHPFFAPFRTVRGAVGAADALALQDAARSAIAENVLPAQRKLREFFLDVYLRAAPTEVGLARLPDGDALYGYFLRTHTTTSLSAEHIHALGLDEVARIRAEMDALAPKTGYRGTLHDVFESLRDDPLNYYTTGDELLTAYRDLAKRIDPELVKLFDPLPRQPYGVYAVPDSIAPDTTTAYYQPGSLDGRRAGAMYCNLYAPESRPKYEMPVLTLHEAVPGHHLQFALGNELGTLPNFRRVAYYVGYSEGWGLYAESLGYDIGVYDSPKAVFGALTYDMWRAVRLVVDTGMHALGWTRERAITYFLDNAAKTKLDVTNEIDRYLTYPGQACAYKIGQRAILGLRDRAQATLGPAFDIRAFHAVVLGAGSLPLDVLETRVATWLAAAARISQHS